MDTEALHRLEGLQDKLHALQKEGASDLPPQDSAMAASKTLQTILHPGQDAADSQGESAEESEVEDGQDGNAVQSIGDDEERQLSHKPPGRQVLDFDKLSLDDWSVFGHASRHTIYAACVFSP